MQLNIDANGLVHLKLEPDEQINVQIGSVEVVLIGGIVGTLGEGPLVQIMLQEPTARLEMKHFPPHLGNEYLDVRVVPEETDEP